MSIPQKGVSAGAVTAIGNSYNLAKVITVDMGQFPSGSAFAGRVSIITAQISSIASSAATLTLKVCKDAAGDEAILSDSSNTMVTGITTATDGTAQWDASEAAIVFDSGQTFHCWLKTDTGTVTCDSISISYI